MSIPNSPTTGQAITTPFIFSMSTKWIAVMLLGIAGFCAVFGSVPITILGFIFSVTGTSISSAVESIAMVANANMLPFSEIICGREGCANIAVSIRSIRSSTRFPSVVLFYTLSIPSTVTAVAVTTVVTEHLPDATSSNWIPFLIIGIVVLILLWFGVNGHYDFGPTHRGRFNLWMGPRDIYSRERFTSEENASPHIPRATSVPC